MIHPNGMVDSVYASTNNIFVGIPYNTVSCYFNDDMFIHRNILAYLTKQQNKLFT